MRLEEILDILENNNKIPTINKEITEIIKMLKNTDTLDIEEFSYVINRCSNLKEAILININSGYFKLLRKIESLSDAIKFLGLKTVEKLVIAHLVKSIMPDNLGQSKQLDRDKYWKHCLGTSVAANLIAEKLNKADIYKYFAYGLIHDLGVVVLDVCVPDLIDKVMEKQRKGMHQIIAERIVMNGFTHEDAGRWQCIRFELPDDIRSIVEYHHRPLLAKKYKEEVYILSIADSISNVYYENLLAINTKHVFNKKVMDELGISKDDLEEIIDILPEKVEEASRQINFNMLSI
ncbi:MAG: HDOD domain-containing protein [Clostridiales bacterium]|nr:HDOD domain-containing protein [Clostridiales bacterium]